jgi:plastocyanin
MAAPIRFLSGRNQQQKIGIEGSTENQKVLEVVGRVGIGTTIFEPDSELEVRGDVKISGILTASNIDVSTGQVNFSQLNVSGASTFTGAIDANGSIDVDGHTELDDVNVSGASTFTGAADFNGSIDVDGHTELDDLNVSGVSTFVGLGTFKNDLYVSDNVYIAGFVTATRLYSSVFGEFTGSSVSADNLVGSALSISGLSTFTGAAEFKSSIDVDGHTELDDLNVSGVSTFAGAIDANGNLDVDGQTELDDVNVSGISTFAGAADFNGSIDVDGHTELDDVNVSGAITATTFTGNLAGTVNTAAQPNITSVGTLSALTVSGDITANGNIAGDNSTNITGIASVTATTLSGTLQTAAQTNITSVGTLTGLDINGHSELDDVNVSGAITATTFTGNLAGTINTAAQTNITSLGTLSALTVSGDITANGNIAGDNSTNITGIAGVTASTLTGTLQTAAQTNVTSVGTLSALTVSGDITANGNIAGDNSTNITGIAGVTASTLTGTLQTAAQTNVTSVGTLTGLDVNGHSELDNVNVSGIITTASLNATGKLTTTGIGISIANGAGNTAYIEGPSEIWIDPSPAGAGTTSGSVRIRGDLYVDGTEFIVDVDKIELGDFNIGIASTVSTNSLLDGAGLGIGATSIRKFITWNNATSALMSSENWNLASGKHYEIDGTDVLTSDTLGSGVINSSLTSVGTLGALTVSGNVNANGNIIGDSATNISGINSVTATSLHGNGSNITDILVTNVIGAVEGISIENEGSLVGAANSVGNINFVSSNLTATASGVGATITFTNTPTFDTVAVTNNITANGNIVGDNSTNISGINSVTATLFHGSGANLTSIPNSALTNDSVSFGGVSVDLGASDATPAFNLSDATNYPTSSLTGTITNAQLAGSIADGKLASTFLKNVVEDTTPQLGGNLDFNSKFITGTGGINVSGVVTATTFSGNLPTSDLTGTITNAQLAGSIANSKLANDSVSFGGVSVDLGASDATPAFNLSDATNYPTSSLTGTITNAQLAGSIADGKLASTFLKNVVEDTTPQLGGNLDLNSKFITGTGGINISGVLTATSYDIELNDLSDATTSSTSLLLGTGVSSNSTENTVVGQNAGAAIDSRKNTYVGTEAGRYIEDEENTGIGNRSLGGATGSVQTGTIRRNTSVGNLALSKLANGATENTAVGAYSGEDITTAGGNTLVGNYAGTELTTGGSNTFIGNRCGAAATTATDNTGVGYYALNVNTGTKNVAIGYEALDSNTTASKNTALGYQAGDVITTGENNICIGYEADASSATASNEITLGNSDITTFRIPGIGVTFGESGANISGIVTAVSFSGSGANLTNLPASTNITVADESSDTTCFPVFTTAATGSLAPKSGSNLTFNSSNGTLTATTFSGALSGNATSATNVTVTANNSTNETVYPVFVDGATGSQGAETDTGLSYNPSTGLFTAVAFSGSGANLTSIPNSALTNDSVSFGGVSVDLGSSDSTPAFNLSDATDYPTSSLTGTITNAQLAGSIADGKLASTFLKNVVEDTTPQLGGNLDLNSKFISGTGGISVTGIVTATSLDAAISEWVLGANGSSDYTFTGPGLTGAENDPSIYLVRGQKYNFKNSSGGHPFRIQSTPNGSTGTQYNDGITNNDAGNGVTLNWDVQFDAPGVLYYQCTSHAAMGGKIYIGNSGESIVVGAAVTINSSGINATGVVTATSFVGDGSTLTGIAAGGSGEFNTGITSSRQIVPLSFESTVFTFPSTAGRQYVIESINVANVDASVGLGTTVNIIASIQDATAAEQTYIAYNVPIVTGGLIELLKNPIVAGPSDVIKMWSTNDGYAGVSNATEVYMSYSEFESTDYISKFASTTTINSTDAIALYTSTSNPTAIEKIGFANRTDTGDFPISIKITNGTTTSYLAKDLIIPRYSTVDILDRPKRIETGAKIEVEVGSTSTVDVIISGKKITS